MPSKCLFSNPTTCFITIIFRVTKLPKYIAATINWNKFTWLTLMWTLFPVSLSSIFTLSRIGCYLMHVDAPYLQATLCDYNHGWRILRGQERSNLEHYLIKCYFHSQYSDTFSIHASSTWIPSDIKIADLHLFSEWLIYIFEMGLRWASAHLLDLQFPHIFPLEICS